MPAASPSSEPNPIRLTVAMILSGSAVQESRRRDEGLIIFRLGEGSITGQKTCVSIVGRFGESEEAPRLHWGRRPTLPEDEVGMAFNLGAARTILQRAGQRLLDGDAAAG